MLLGCSVGILAVDALLLEWSQHPFTAGMAARYSLRAPGTVALYGSVAWLLDVSLILGPGQSRFPCFAAATCARPSNF